MRGSDERTGSLFSYVDLEARVRGDHPLRVIREIANAALLDLSRAFAALYTDFGRPSIAPEKLLRAMLLQAFYGIRSERQLVERLEFDLLFRWFVGLGVDGPYGIIRPSPRTATGCWRGRSPPSSFRRFWPSRR
jgi:transposase